MDNTSLSHKEQCAIAQAMLDTAAMASVAVAAGIIKPTELEVRGAHLIASLGAEAVVKLEREQPGSFVQDTLALATQISTLNHASPEEVKEAVKQAEADLKAALSNLPSGQLDDFIPEASTGQGFFPGYA